jgi:hypothetical protein
MALLGETVLQKEKNRNYIQMLGILTWLK